MKRKLLFERSFASSKRAINWSKRNVDKPEDCSISSGEKIWFDCHDCFHEFEMQLSNITNGGQWCSYCSNKKLCSYDNCKICFEKSFASHERAIYWSHKNKKNPRECFKSSGEKYWFDCRVCNHEFEMQLNSITNMNSWCSYCSNKKLCSDDNCKICFEKSFASHEMSEFWSSKNKKNPRDCFKGTNTNFWFNCRVCNHEFEIRLSNITNGGQWCPYCANKKLCSYDNCKICFEKSFASHEMSEYWAPKNIKSPRDYLKNSHKKLLFNCPLCKHEFEMQLDYITNGGHWCPNCKHKTERKLYNFLKLQPFPIKRQFKADWCRNPKTNRLLPFDFEIETLKIIFELDGPQHNSLVPHFHRNGISDLIAQKDRDLYKYQKAIENGYTVYRLDQESVLHDRIDWKSLILEIINNK